MTWRKACLTVAMICAAVASAEEPAWGMKPLAGRIGVKRGVCVLVGKSVVEGAIDLARSSELTIYAQLATDAEVVTARKAAFEADLLNTRMFVARGDSSRIGLADNLADAVVAPADTTVPKAEVLRVLRPGGKALLGRTEVIKPVPDGVDDWSHHYHGPDNNSQSNDRLAKAPYLTQFIVEPRYGPAPQAAVASGGRVFAAFGHVAWHKREEPVLNTLFAFNGYNGTVLWKRPLPEGLMVDRSTMIATPTTLYLADHTSCKLIDAATGKVTDEIVAPQDITGGPFWKWMALEDGVLYALIGEDEPRDPVARWGRRGHGWPWGGISQGYNKGPYAWGFGKALLAIDPKTKRVLWHHREEQPIDSRAICMKNGRIYLASFGKYLTCLDAKTGEEVWRRTAERDPDLFKAIGPYRPGHGYIGGWKSTVYLKCTDEALYVLGPQVNWLTCVSAKDGTFLWKYNAKDLHIVIRGDGVYTIGSQRGRGHTKKLDPETGSVLASYDINRRACTRSTGTADGIFFRAPGGSVRLDLTTGKPQWISPMRPSCHVGVIPANGHLYWLPWACDCNLQMFGVISVAPAGDFAFNRKGVEGERLESAADANTVTEFAVASGDWPTYRANNARTAATDVEIPARVELLWRKGVRNPPRVPDTFGNSLEPTAPIAAGGLVLVSGSDGVVRAVDAASGETKWQAYTGGAIRFPPTVADGRVFVGSGDGWAYAFEAATGRLLWRFRAAPVERKIRVYDTLLSTWPVAAGIIVEDGVAYLAAGINNFDGTHVYALDAATGGIMWQNNASGHLEGESRRGVGVQGDLLLHGGKLYLAGGNAASPGTYDIKTGKCLTRPPTNWGSRAPRGRELRLKDNRITVSGQPFYSVATSPVYDRSTAWGPVIVTAGDADLSFARSQTDAGPVWRLVARRREENRTLWEQPLPAAPVRWGVAVDAEGRIIVTLTNGQVVCFGRPKDG